MAKRIALFLARTSSQQTIDHLVYEISQQINEDDGLSPVAGAETGVSIPIAACASLLASQHNSNIIRTQVCGLTPLHVSLARTIEVTPKALALPIYAMSSNILMLSWHVTVYLGPAVLQAAEFHHVRWPSHHSRHRSGGGHSSADFLRSDNKSSTPTGESSQVKFVALQLHSPDQAIVLTLLADPQYVMARMLPDWEHVLIAAGRNDRQLL